MKIVIAGASGFVGQALLDSLARVPTVRVRGLTRSARATPWKDFDGWEGPLQWARCDLFSLVQAEHVLAGARVAVYLVHSMEPSSRLVQGSFSDIDLLLADNFARAARKAGVERIVYLGGIFPDGEARLSKHLKSRHEVEEALAGHGVPVRVLRAGVVLGENGSSSEIMFRLVERLPIIFCPPWTRRCSSPIALSDAVRVLDALILNEDLPGPARTTFESAGQVTRAAPHATLDVYDAAGADVARYLDLLRESARLLGKKRLFLPLPFFPPKLSAFWVAMITGFSRALVTPLVDSLRFHLIPDANRRLPRAPMPEPMGWRETLARVLAERMARQSNTHAKVRLGVAPSATRDARVSNVISIQRLPCPPGWNAVDVAAEYAAWLPVFFRPLLRVANAEGRVSFYLWPLRTPLLVLELSSTRSDETRMLYYIRGGALAVLREGNRGRLEFRMVKNGTQVLATVLDFEPSLPWPVYRLSQAIAHLVVMTFFGWHLASCKRIP